MTSQDKHHWPPRQAAWLGGRVLWLIDISLLATIMVNLIYVAYDQR